MTLMSRLFLMNVKVTLKWVTDWLLGLKWLIHGSYPTGIANLSYACLWFMKPSVELHSGLFLHIFVLHATNLTSILTFCDFFFFFFFRLVSSITGSLILMVRLYWGQLSITILNTMRWAGVENQSKRMTSPAMCSWRMLEKTTCSTIQRCLQVRRRFDFFAVVIVWYAE